MKTFTRWLLALVLVAIPMMAVVQTASANTELTPASRLVAPFVTIETGRSTFLLITNVQFATGVPSVQLDRTKTSPVGAVHIEFYDKTCSRSDTVIDLTPGDIDQINVTSSIANLPSSIGFADIDVRTGSASLANSSIQENVLIGSVVVTDATNDFAFSYPMASSIGSSGVSSVSGCTGGVAGCTIVTRTVGGDAAAWVGRYEPFPSRIMVPGFFAEGTDASGRVVSTFLAVASPADGNWYGFAGIGDGVGEAPGENLASIASGGVLINAGTIMWDGCERNTSQPLTGHYVNGSLGSLYGTIKTDRANWTATCGVSFPGKDEVSGNPVGWIEFPNASCTRASAVPGNRTNTCSTTTQSASVARARGLVGLFFEQAVSTSSKLGDASRLWGDRTTISSQTGCLTSGGAALTPAACAYSLITGTP